LVKEIVQLVIVSSSSACWCSWGCGRCGRPDPHAVTRDQLTNMSEAEIAQLRHEAGLDRNIAVQYLSWVGGLFKGDMGRSIVYKTRVSDEIFRRLPSPLRSAYQLDRRHVSGSGRRHISAVKRGSWIDTAVTSVANAGTTVPIFWLPSSSCTSLPCGCRAPVAAGPPR